MTFPQTIEILGDGVWLMPGNEDDLSSILALWDETVAWLVAKGIEGQWGTTPFSQLPAMRERLLSWLRNGELFIAREGDAYGGPIVATLALVDTIPSYAVSAWGSVPDKGLYLEAFTTARMRHGSGLGRALLEWVEAYTLEQGKTVLRFDCWAENTALQAYYHGAGFQPRGTFRLGNWEGQMFEKRLSNTDRGDAMEPR
ncbi:MAG: N-acetyltransferase family protein [Ktedonobacterales bacterium]